MHTCCSMDACAALVVITIVTGKIEQKTSSHPIISWPKMASDLVVGTQSSSWFFWCDKIQNLIDAPQLERNREKITFAFGNAT